QKKYGHRTKSQDAGASAWRRPRFRPAGVGAQVTASARGRCYSKAGLDATASLKWVARKSVHRTTRRSHTSRVTMPPPDCSGFWRLRRRARPEEVVALVVDQDERREVF